MRKATLLFAVALFNGLLETSHATTCTATTDETCEKTLFMTGSCSSSVCKCSSGYVAGPYGCQVKQKATISADFAEVVVDGTILLECEPTGSTSEYKWYKDGTEISSAADQTYTKADAATGDSGAFTCTSMVAGLETEKSDELAVAVVAVATATPEVTGMPAKVAVGMEITFICVGGPKNEDNVYAWSAKTGPITGAASATYKHTVVTGDDANTIQCARSGKDSVVIDFPSSLATDVDGAEVKAVSSLKLIVGETLTLECQLTGGFPPGDSSTITYAWIKDDSAISSGGDSFSYTKSSVASDSGAYKCSVKFESNAALESAAVTVAVETTLAKDKVVPSNSESLTGGYFSLTCNIKSVTTVDLKYTWTKDATLLLGVTDKVLQFNEATSDYNGDYSCTATGDDGTVTNVGVTVDAAAVTDKTPVVTMSPTDIGIGDTLTFTCGDGSVGSPGMTYKWSVGSAEQSGKTSKTFEYTPESSDSVTITCNYVFDSTSSQGGDKSITAKYIFSVALQVAEATVTSLKPVAASKVKVSCFVTKSAGAGTCTYKWKKGGTDITGATSEVFEITAGADGSGAETYKCEATCKPAGTLPVTSADLTVTPQANPEKPTITADPDEAPVELGKLVLICESDSYAEGATFVWKKDGVVVSGKTGMSLTFKEVVKDNDGAYVCEITVGGQASGPSDATTIATKANKVSCDYPQDCDGEHFNSNTCKEGKCECENGYLLKGGLCTAGSGMVMASLMVIVSALLAQFF